ncbi:MAG: EamA family transporter, partial [Flavobacterium sp.]
AHVKSKENIWIDLKKGYEYLKTSPDLSSMILMMAASSLLVIPFTTLLPVFAKDIFNGDATTFGWFESAAGFGAFFGAIYMATRKAGQNLQKIVIVSGGLLAVAVIALAIAPTLILALVCTVLMYLMITEALQKISAFTVNLSFNLEPLYSIVLAIIIYRENTELSWAFYIGLTLIVFSVVLQMYRVIRQKQLVTADIK